MNTYLISIRKYFSGEEKLFTIDADSKQDAVIKGTEFVNKNPIFSGGNYNLDTIKCVKKLRKDIK